MPGGEELATLRRGPVQPALGQEPVERRRAPRRASASRSAQSRTGSGPRTEDRDGERGGEQHVLPGGDDVERGAADADVPQLRHDEVVDREPDDEDGERDARQAALAHVIATSVRPRLTIRTGPGKRPPQVAAAEQVVLPRPAPAGEVVGAVRARPAAASGRAAAACAPRSGTSGSASSGTRAGRRAAPRPRRAAAARRLRRARSPRSRRRRRTPGRRTGARTRRPDVGDLGIAPAEARRRRAARAP